MMKSSKITHLLSNINKRSPNIGKFLFLLTHILYLLKFLIDTTILKIKYWKKFGKINFNKISWISPDKIQHFIKNRLYFNWNNSNRIRDGNWDSTKRPIDQLLIIYAIEQRFIEGKNWEDTEVYNLIPSKKPKGEKRWTFKNEIVRDRNLKEIERYILSN